MGTIGAIGHSLRPLLAAMSVLATGCAPTARTQGGIASSAPAIEPGGQGGSRHADAWGSGRDDSEARREAIRIALAQLYGTYVASSLTVVDDQLVEDRIRSFGDYPDVRIETLARESRPDGSVRIQVRVSKGRKPESEVVRPSSIPAGGSAPEVKVGGAEIADGLGARRANDREALELMATLATESSVASIDARLYHIDGRPFEPLLSATDDVVRTANGEVELRTLVQLRPRSAFWTTPPASRLRKMLRAIARRVVPDAAEIVCGEVMGLAPLSRAPVMRGRSTVHGLQRPTPGDASVILPAEGQPDAGAGFVLRLDQYILPSDALPDPIRICTEVRVVVRDKAGNEIRGAAIPMGKLPYLLELASVTNRTKLTWDLGEIDVGGARAATVGWPPMVWGFHAQSGQLGKHLVLTPFALSAGTLAGDAAATAPEVEILVRIRLTESELRRTASVTAEPGLRPVSTAVR